MTSMSAREDSTGFDGAAADIVDVDTVGAIVAVDAVCAAGAATAVGIFVVE